MSSSANTSKQFVLDGPPLKRSSKDMYSETDDSEIEVLDNRSEIGSNSDESDPEYEVEKILGKRIRSGKIYYLLKWVGYESRHNSWEPISNLNCDEMVEEFEEMLRKRNNIFKRDVFGSISSLESCDAGTGLANDSGIADVDCEQNNSNDREEENGKEIESKSRKRKLIDIESEDSETDDQMADIEDNYQNDDFGIGSTIFDINLSDEEMMDQIPPEIKNINEEQIAESVGNELPKSVAIDEESDSEKELVIDLNLSDNEIEIISLD